MKKLFLALSVVAVVVLTGCATSTPVPTSHMSGTIAGQKFEMDFPKDTTITNLTVKIETNGAASLTLGYLSAVNNSNVIGSAYAGRADEFKAVGDAVLNGMNAGAGIAGKFVGTAVKTP